MALDILACSFGSLAAQPGAPAVPAANAGGGSCASFTLTLPNGQTMPLQVTCTGVKPGSYLDIQAKNNDDANDPNHTVVKVGGNYAAAGQPENIYIEVTIGPANAWAFMGNTPSAAITMNADGSGSFSDIAIVNAAGTSASYNAGGEYKFSAQWKCTP